uniref:hypothetical protein n=1 Tax=Okeania sp. SIO2F4 TaxID=2607790 RepID=UPI0025D59E95
VTDTSELMNNVSQLLSNEAIITSYTEAIGNGLPKFYQTIGIASPASNYGQILVKIDKSYFGRGKTYETLT